MHSVFSNWKRTMRLLVGTIIWFTLTTIIINGAHAADPAIQRGWSVGGAIGFLANSPDDTAFALNLNGDIVADERVSFGPLLQLGFTGDMTLVGFSGQGKYAIPIEGNDRFKILLQGGIGFVHADPGPADTSFLIPLGVGLDYQLNSQLAVKTDFLLNFTDLDHRGHNDTNVMPSLTFGIRF